MGQILLHYTRLPFSNARATKGLPNWRQISVIQVNMRNLLAKACLALVAATLASVQAIAEMEELDVGGISNYSMYSGDTSFAGDMVGFGGATQPMAMPWLKQQGFATVINLRLAEEQGADIEVNQTAAAVAGLKYINLPFNAGDPAHDIEERFLAVASDASNQPVYIHCGSGTRAAILWMTGRFRKDGLSAEAVKSEGIVIAEKPGQAMEYFSARMLKRADS